MGEEDNSKSIEYCFCTLVLGEKYHTIGKIFLESYVQNIHNNTKIIVVTDAPEILPVNEKIVLVPFTISKPGPFISLKWLAYKEALNLGYSNICYIDADSIAKPEFDEVLITSNTQDGLGCNWLITYNETSPFRSRAAKKLQSLIKPGERFPIKCPVECFMFLRGNRARSINFINEWENIWKQIRENRLFHREVCHEIGLAASRADMPVYKYKAGRKTYLGNFSHYGNPKAKKEMVEKYG